jgi:hypothetical protein
VIFNEPKGDYLYVVLSSSGTLVNLQYSKNVLHPTLLLD